MLHNTGPYGSNDNPVNMSASVNVPDISNPIGIAENLSNLVKMSQQTSHPNMGHYNLPHYSNYVGGSMSENSQFRHHHFINHDLTMIPPNISSKTANMFLNGLNQNGLHPEMYNFHNERPHTLASQKYYEPSLHHTSSITSDAPMLKNAPQISILNNKNKVFFRKNSLTSNNVQNDCESSIPSKNLINTVIESEYHNQTDSDSRNKVQSNKDYLSSENTNDSSEDNPSENLTTEPDTTRTDYEDNSSTLVHDLTIKQEPREEESDVVVKVEPISSWMDMDFTDLFHKDSNGVLREESLHGNVIESFDSVSEAMNMVKNGLTTDKYFECPNCCLLFSHPKRFLIHYKWHGFGSILDKKVEESKDKRKRKKDDDMENLEAPAPTVPEKPAEGSLFPCKNCDKVFPSKNSLRCHRQKMHPNREHECKLCHKIVLGWYGLKTHMATHNTEGCFPCLECPKTFKHAHSLAKHRDTHLERTQACPQCPKKFGSQVLLKMHMKTHERVLKGPTFSCSYCARGFYEAYTLAVHERSHRNERPYHCEICNTSYGTNSSLKRHVKVSHTSSSKKPFECTTCHRCFHTEMIRDRHAAREHGTPGQLPYGCTKCSSRYMRIKDLRRHMYRVHPKGKKRRKHSESE